MQPQRLQGADRRVRGGARRRYDPPLHQRWRGRDRDCRACLCAQPDAGAGGRGAGAARADDAGRGYPREPARCDGRGG
ncbi:hypothetical protein WR25_18409 [Diploscapter pachys]|uniref:Uncharacterized protein n=1 Tax=Diploscapter pachys TaxID=2018661 RepID=A0A2A2JXE8_9BILA|nr:hypothetical protein WR25_18409 [Diploscapter pachys]